MPRIAAPKPPMSESSARKVADTAYELSLIDDALEHVAKRLDGLPDVRGAELVAATLRNARRMIQSGARRLEPAVKQAADVIEASEPAPF